MSEMVERVARLVCRAAGDYPDDDEFNFLGGEPIGKAWEKYIPNAREIIEAMREITDDMIRQFSGPQYGVYGDVEATAIYRKMIDVALNSPITFSLTGNDDCK